MSSAIKEIINYIEDNLFENLEIKNVARKFSYSENAFRMLFKSNFNITINEYINKRRLTMIAFKIKIDKTPFIECSEMLFYKNVESFYKAFKKFHLITPGQVLQGKSFKCFNRLEVSVLIEGGDIMHCKTKNIGKIKLTGFRTRMTGDVLERFEQEADFFENTRDKQELLFSISKNYLEERRGYTISNNFYDDSFDFYIAYECNGHCPSGFELIEIPEGEYYSFETERCRKPVSKLKSVWKNIGKNIGKINLPMIEIYHWYLPETPKRDERYIETLIYKQNDIK